MNNLKQKLLIEQLDKKLNGIRCLERETIPYEGWIYNIRTALRMSLRQLGINLGISTQGVKQIELREKIGSLTIKRLTEVGNTLNMKFFMDFYQLKDQLKK
jgi:transcriptional regulator with XRE-family HTH domain